MISIYKNIFDTTSKEHLPIDIFLQNIQIGKWQDLVLKIRIIQDKDERKKAKSKCPYATISGLFGDNRDANNLKLHSGFISMDIDNIGNEIEATKQLLSTDPYVYSCFVSISGTGLCVLFKINTERHADSFDAIADYLLTKYQIVIDPSGRDVCRPRFVSYDPFLYINENSLTFKKYLPKKKPLKIISTIFVKTEFDEVVNEMVKANVSCVEDYRDWRDIAFGLADQFGEGGRSYFHQLSSCSSKYEGSMCDKQYTNALKSNNNKSSKITIATIYYYAKKAGINIYSEKTKKIAAATSSQKRAGLSAEKIAENLQKFEGINKQDADDIIKQAFTTNHSFSGSETMVDNLRTHLRHMYTLKRNEITRKIENDGKPLDEIDLNTMFLDAKVIFDEVTFDLFMKVIYSNNTIQYNPLTEWFENNKGDGAGYIDALFSAFDTTDDIKYFGKKWLVSIVAAVHGEHSPLMLILAGEKQGTGKTEAFRRLLPKELRQYYAESKLDAGKDDEILMTQKLIIMDDEMGGKSKSESKRLKELTSKQTFTLREPYGRMNVDLQRLAVLCGTTNDLQILNDPTGNRRLLPMQINGIDFKSYNDVDKTLVFIEAYNLYKSGFEWNLSKDDVLKLAGETTKFEEVTLERQLILKYYNFPNNFQYDELTATDIKIHIENKSNQRISLRKLGVELKSLGFKCEYKKVNGNTKQVYLVDTIVESTFNQFSNAPF